MTSSLTAPSILENRTPIPACLTAATLPYSQRLSRATLTGVALAHATLLAALLLSAADVPEPATPPRPLTISLIVPEVEVPQPKPSPMPSKPVVKPLTPSPVRVVKRQLPSPQAVVETPKPAPQLEPLPEVQPPPAPVAAEAPQAPAPAPSPPRAADYLSNPKPPYPALSKRLGEEGTVRLNILVNPDGSVARLELAKSSGHPRLDSSAMDTVQSSWKFEPARQGGRPVAAWVIVPIQFTLRS